MTEKFQSKEVAPETIQYREGVIGLITSHDLMNEQMMNEWLHRGNMPDDLEFLCKLPENERRQISTEIALIAEGAIEATADGELPSLDSENFLQIAKILGFCPPNLRLRLAEKKMKWAIAEELDPISGYTLEQEVNCLLKNDFISQEEAIQLVTKVRAKGIILASDTERENF